MIKGKAKKRSFQGRAQVLSVHDGDTFTAYIDLGLNIYTRCNVRVRGVNTPELPSMAGNLATDFLKKILVEGTVVYLVIHRLDLHGRAESDVYLSNQTQTDDQNERIEDFDRILADEIIAAGQGVPADARGNL